MVVEAWPRVSRILDRALELSSAERPAFLLDACGDDAQMLAYVERLLAADAEAHGILELEPSAALFGAFSADVGGDAIAPLIPGQRLGPWRMLREIGHGGMGAVVLAERADGAYEQRVAIKRIRRGLISEELLQRFARERRIVARLEHPNIARAVDGGTADDGTPWLAMEYVAGRPITDWCAQQQPNLDATLALFGQVARAVQFAHQHFVIHRDLKPSNILVTDTADVKLLDFGIAKLMEADEGESAVTIDLERRLTPHYAAPEQVSGGAVSAATDVYALGVVLYELLTGVRPHESSRNNVMETVRRMLEEDPPSPTVVLRRSDCPTRNREWQSKVRGDLDNIVMKALRRDPVQRYASVQALEDDVERWRRREQVLATPPTLAYRAGRFFERNRTPVLAASVVVLSLLGGLFASLWQARVAAQERDRARLEATKATRISAFVSSLFDVADPNVAKGDSLTVRSLLDRGAERIEQELAGQPEVQAEMFDRLGLLYLDFNMFPQAQRMAERRVAASRVAYGVASAEVAAALTQLGGVLTNQGRFAAAESVLTNARGISQRLHQSRPLEMAQTLAWLGTVHRMLQRYDQAEALFRESISIKEKQLGPDHRDLSPDVNALGQTLRDSGRPLEALPLLERGLAIRTKALGPNHLETAQSMEDLARTYQYLDRFEEAEALHLRTLEIRRQLVGPQHVSLARTLSPLAFVYISRKQYARADSLLSEALRLFHDVLGDEHPETLNALTDLGWLRTQRGDFPAAESLLTRAHQTASRIHGSDHPLARRALENTANLRRAMGQLEESEQLRP